MYLTHFKMKHQPFQVYPPIDGILTHNSFNQGKARLDYFISQMSELALIIADEGMGKSTLCRYFLHHIKQQTCYSVYLSFTRLSSLSFLRLLVTHLGETATQQKDNLLQQITKKLASINTTAIIIIDDAHLLTDETLLDLRLLLGLNQEKQLLKFIFISNSSMKKRLKESQHSSLAGRCSLLCNLPIFSEELTREYIDFQIKYSGASKAIFDSSIKNEIHQYTHGSPRLINHLATHCLISAAIKKAHIIDQSIFRQALQECPLFV
jgi:general secretion pathway protein A